MKVYFPISPFAKQQAHRGVGRYDTWLKESLMNLSDFQIVTDPHQADLFHYTFFDPFVRSLKPPKHKCPFVVTIHDLTPLVFPRDFPAGRRAHFNLFWQTRSARQADFIITDSQASQHDISQIFSLPTEKIKVVYLAANPNLKPASLAQIKNLRVKYSLPSRYLLYVGDINFNKNLRQLIKTLKFLPPNIHLVMVGKNFFPHEIPEWYAIQEQLHLSEVENRVIFLNQIASDLELSALYTGALAYIQPSYYEGFGLPVLEAMRSGTPVICHRNSSLIEIGGQVAVFSQSLQARDFAAAVQEVLAWTPEQRQNRLNKAYAWEKNFTWSSTAEQVYQIYSQVLAKHANQPAASSLPAALDSSPKPTLDSQKQS